MAKLTHHARERMRERVGIPNKRQKQNIANALRRGLTLQNTTGTIHSYIVYLYKRHYRANNIRIYKGYVYIFHNDVLITVYPLPEQHRAAVDEIFRQRGQHG